MPQPKQRLSKYEITGYVLIITGAVVLVWGTIKFNLVEELYLDPADREGVFGQYGEFIGGIVGSLWALAGVFLFFATLTYQKREFELQRFELHKTQKIFQQQNFSTLYISFIQKHNDIIDSLVAFDINKSDWRGSNFFVFFQEKVLTSFVQKVRALGPEEKTAAELQHIFQDYFTYHFSFYQSSLNPYLKNLSVLFKLIQKYKTETQDQGEYYSFITKANFTQSELFLIYHVVQFNLLKEFSTIGNAFDVYEDMAEENKVEYIVQQELQNA
ncbi:putative phage abortive infection protein [Pontibacter litorisediminis]|uniref:putative phage abortive infection protein n=1 Tax=Pontibacter litorisediminis TaxID=1846260 RepID=UPI0023EB6E09|nr:putative phage abortive infection protein [Pontibacter litorisediminis]